MLVNGIWQQNWQPVQAKDDEGRFIRQTLTFRNWITPDGAPGPTGRGGFKAEPGRYHLYVAYICLPADGKPAGGFDTAKEQQVRAARLKIRG